MKKLLLFLLVSSYAAHVSSSDGHLSPGEIRNDRNSDDGLEGNGSSDGHLSPEEIPPLHRFLRDEARTSSSNFVDSPADSDNEHAEPAVAAAGAAAAINQLVGGLRLLRLEGEHAGQRAAGFNPLAEGLPRLQLLRLRPHSSSSSQDADSESSVKSVADNQKRERKIQKAQRRRAHYKKRRQRAALRHQNKK